MSKTVNTGYTDTAIEGVTSLDFPRGLLNFAADFRVKSNTPGKEIVITNITSPTDRPEKIRIGYSEIPNVYKDSGIEPSLTAPSKKGISVLAQVTEVLSVTETTDPDYRIDLPVSFHLVMKVPASEYITSDVIKAGIGRLLSSLYDTGSLAGSRLEGLLRGSLTPTEL